VLYHHYRMENAPLPGFRPDIRGQSKGG
jgi:hypothetical protein